MGSNFLSGYGPWPATLLLISSDTTVHILSILFSILVIFTTLLIVMRLNISNFFIVTTTSIFIQSLPITEADSVPRINVQLKGNTNYKRWALIVKGMLVVMGLWYAITKPKPSPQIGTITVTGGTGNGILNKKEMEEWDEANDSTAAVISMSCGETAVNLLDSSWTVKTRWDMLLMKGCCP